MIPSPVNRLLLTTAFVLACSQAGQTKLSTADTNVTRPETTTVKPATAVTDSNITRADVARIQGSPNAPVWVILVSDFQCPYCKEWHDQTYSTFRDEFVKTGKVRLAYVNFPLNSHVFAWPAAEAAMCAAAQGKFWEMHDALFATQNHWEGLPSPTPVFDSLARSVGVDVKRWQDCVTSGEMKPLIQADHDRAARAGAAATPSFMIGDRILAGAQPIEEMRAAVDSALAKSKKTSP